MKHCCWILTHGHITALCNAPATHVCKESDSHFCDYHAEEYADCFGEGILREIPIEEEKAPILKGARFINDSERGSECTLASAELVWKNDKQ